MSELVASRAKNRRREDIDKQERRLYDVVFGGGTGYEDGSNGELDRVSDDDEQSIDDTPVDLESDEGFDGLEELSDSDLFFADLAPDGHPDRQLTEDGSNGHRKQGEGVLEEVRLWEDSDDERVQISLASSAKLRKLRRSEEEDKLLGFEYIHRLRAQYEILHPRPAWASFDPTETQKEAYDDERHTLDSLQPRPLQKILCQSMHLLKQDDVQSQATCIELQADMIDMHRLPDLKDLQPSAITILAFHPSMPLLLTGGPSGLLSLYHISRDAVGAYQAASKLHISRAADLKAFLSTRDGGTVFFSCARGLYASWNIMQGRTQQAHGALINERRPDIASAFSVSPSGQWLAQYGWLRNGGVTLAITDLRQYRSIAETRIDSARGIADVAWWPNEKGLIILGKGGQVLEYSIITRIVVTKWKDEGAVAATTIALGGHRHMDSQDGNSARFLAIGSTNGIVNLYDQAMENSIKPSNSARSPIKCFDQLITPVSHLSFSPDGQILCMASKWKRDALRLVHLPSCNIYQNWPSSNTPLGRITSIAWSSDHLLAVANEQGKCRLWQIRG